MYNYCPLSLFKRLAKHKSEKNNKVNYDDNVNEDDDDDEYDNKIRVTRTN